VDRAQVLFRLFGKYCPEGTILYTEGAPGDELCLVQSGAVRLGPAAGEPAREVGPGGILGEEAFFGRAPRPRRAEILRDTHLLLVGERNVDSFARNGPEAALGLLAGLVGLAAAARGALEGGARGGGAAPGPAGEEA
jgi:CRP-like cAMP-binding protein